MAENHPVVFPVGDRKRDIAVRKVIIHVRSTSFSSRTSGLLPDIWRPLPPGAHARIGHPLVFYFSGLQFIYGVLENRKRFSTVRGTHITTNAFETAFSFSVSSVLIRKDFGRRLLWLGRNKYRPANERTSILALTGFVQGLPAAPRDARTSFRSPQKDGNLDTGAAARPSRELRVLPPNAPDLHGVGNTDCEKAFSARYPP